MENEPLVVSASDVARCRVFAEKSVGTSLDQYARRHQTNLKTIQHQIEVGKIGELAVHEWIIRQGLRVDVNAEPLAWAHLLTEPDFAIYDARHKTFAADMTFDGIPIHVKSQDRASAERFGISWTFQYGAKVGSDKEIFSPNPKGFVAFALVTPGQTTSVTLYGFPKVETLHRYDLFRDPKLAKLRGIKTVVYNDDLQRSVTDDERWAVQELWS